MSTHTSELEESRNSHSNADSFIVATVQQILLACSFFVLQIASYSFHSSSLEMTLILPGPIAAHHVQMRIHPDVLIQRSPLMFSA